MWLTRRYGITNKIKTERGKDIKTDRKNNKDKDEKRKYYSNRKQNEKEWRQIVPLYLTNFILNYLASTFRRTMYNHLGKFYVSRREINDVI